MSKKEDERIFNPPERATFKTYTHLADKKRIPNEYELTSSRMLYYPEKGGFEVKTPISDWYERYQKKSLIQSVNLELFADPAQTTYTSYIRRQKDKEIVLDASSKHIDATGYDQQLDKIWVDSLSQLLAPLRYPWHGFQMISSYLGSMAPEGKLAIVFAFQTMDEMRRIQRIAYRMRQLQESYPSWGNNSAFEWQHAAHWQPLRKSIEYLLVTYDWLEAFVALNLCFKPVLDHLLLVHYAHIAKKQADYQLGVLFHSFWEDALWQQTWSMELLALILKQNEKNKRVVMDWLARWIDELITAVLAMEPLFPADFNVLCESVFASYQEQLNNADLNVKVKW